MAVEVKAFLDRIKPGDGAIDVGANVGAVTTQLAKAVGATGHVLAVEPQAKAVQMCERECRVFPWVTVTRTAVSDHAGVVPFYAAQDLTIGSCAKENVTAVSDTFEVPCETLDALAERVPNLTAIKIDAQGAEGLILRGASRLLQRSGLTWMVEIWPAGLAACGSSVAELVRLFAGWRVLAVGKRLDGPGMTWAELAAHVQSWSGPSHTNIVVGRA